MTTCLKPKYISVDCHGTLINFQMADLARELFADRIKPEDMARLDLGGLPALVGL